MIPSVDTKSSTAVELFVEESFSRLYPGSDLVWLRRIFRDIELLFGGGHPDFAAIDIRYHDLEHTLQAAVCLTVLLERRASVDARPVIDARHFELALSAVLLHDSGYLKLRSDTVGTGAKYTFCHVLRSCAFAATYLPTLGANDYEVEAVMAAINCTGPANEVTRLYFRDPAERIIGCALGTADFLSQMAAPDYPDELEILFGEFNESDNFLNVPHQRRMFSSADDLIANTPAFWEQFVKPKLEHDFQSVYRFLSRPYPNGGNDYICAVEDNIVRIRRKYGLPESTPAVTSAHPIRH